MKLSFVRRDIIEQNSEFDLNLVEIMGKRV